MIRKRNRGYSQKVGLTTFETASPFRLRRNKNMKDIIAMMMLLPIMLFFMLQPMLHDAEMARGIVLETVVQRATEKAALVGYYTPDILDELKQKLEEVGYEENEIEIEATDVPVYRGGYVSLTVRVPNKYFFLLFSSLMYGDSEKDHMYHIRSATRMSEYVG
jgi:hypothetical protein